MTESSTKPAWSWQFEPDKYTQPPPSDLPVTITREWAWEGSTGKGVKVGIIDSGVDPTHPAVGSVAKSVFVRYAPEEEGELVIEETEPKDVFGHGTACAGIIKSIAPDCEIYSIRVLGALLSGKGVVFAGGLKWAIENGVNVVNMSLSTKKKDFFGVFHELTDLAYFRNIMLVSAINNVPAPSYPSEYSAVFSVAAHDGKNPYQFHYNPAPPVEFGAPGIDIEVAWQEGKTIKTTGNSFASPHIAGIVTKILGKHPHLTPFQMKTVLAAIADPIPAPAPADGG